MVSSCETTPVRAGYSRNVEYSGLPDWVSTSGYQHKRYLMYMRQQTEVIMLKRW